MHVKTGGSSRRIGRQCCCLREKARKAIQYKILSYLKRVKGLERKDKQGVDKDISIVHRTRSEGWVHSLTIDEDFLFE